MGQPGGPAVARERYRITVRGEFGDLLATAFADVSIHAGGGETVLIADVVDSQELYGLLDRLRDHGVHIVNVNQVPSSAGPEGSATSDDTEG
jgi:hypothetical protein